MRQFCASLNAPEAFHLALVLVDRGFAHQPAYVQRFFRRELRFAETAVVFNIADLLSEHPPLSDQCARLRQPVRIDSTRFSIRRDDRWRSA